MPLTKDIGPGGNGSGGTPTPPAGTLADNEMVKADVGGNALVGTGDTNSDTEVNFGSKDIVTTGTVESGTGTLVLGQSQAIGSAGTNVISRNLQTGQLRSSVDTEYGVNTPIVRIIEGQLDDQVFQPINTETLTANVTWALPVGEDTSLVSLIVEPQSDRTRCKLRGYRDGVEVWSAGYFDLVSGAGPQRVFDAVDPNSSDAPFQFENDGATYELRIESEEGDVFLLGDLSNVPFYALSFSPTTDRPAQTLPDSTGVVSGLVASAGIAPNTFDLSPGYGYILSDDGAAAQFVRVDGIANGFVDVSVDGNYGLGITSLGATTQVPANAVDAAFIRDNMLVGFIEIELGAVTQVSPYQLTTNTGHSQFFDLSEILGVIRGGGLDVNPNADLTIAITAGSLGFRGAGTSQTNRTPNILQLAGRATAQFDVFAGLSSEIRELNQTFINPTVYDDGTALPTPLPVVPQPENATIQYIYQLPFAAGGLSVMYGQTVYPTLEDAQVNQDNDEITIPVEIATNSLLLARLCVRADATNLSDPNQAVWLPGAKLGSSLSGGAVGAGGAGGGDTLGAASSTANELVTFAGADGKSLSSASDLSALAGVIQRLTLNGNAGLLAGNGKGLNINGATSESILETFLLTIRDITAPGSVLHRVWGNAGASAGFIARSDNGVFEFESQSGVLIGRLEWNFSGDGKLALRHDASNIAIAIDTATGNVELTAPAGTARVNEVDVVLDELPSSALPSAASIDVDFAEYEARQTVTLNQNSALVFTNITAGHAVQLEVAGNFTLSFPVEAKKLSGSGDYDGAATNIIYLYASTAGIVDYMIQQRGA